MKLKFEDWSDESDYTWEVVHDDTHFEPHAEPFTYRTFEEWARHYEPIRTTSLGSPFHNASLNRAN